MRDLFLRTHDQALRFLGSLSSRRAAAPRTSLKHRNLPDYGLGEETVLDLIEREVEPNLSGSAGPRYFAFVTGGATPAALAADWLTSTYNQNVSNAVGSAASAVEAQALTMLRELFALPPAFQGAFVTGATMANFAGLATGREWLGERLSIDVSQEGVGAIAGKIRILAATPHSSAIKALSMLGLGRTKIERSATLPGREAIDVDALRASLRQSDAPTMIIASAGTVNTADFDDLAAVIDAAREHGRTYVHVDAAFGLFAAVSPPMSPLLRGIEGADSIASDGHKWLNVPYDCGFVFTRHLALQERVFRASAPYLDTADGTAPDFLNRTPENSRRFRALPVWATLLAYGRDGVRDIVERNCEFARELGAWIEQSEDYELAAPVRMNVVAFRNREGDTNELLELLREDGRAFFTPSALGGRPIIRAAVSNWRTQLEDLPLVTAALHEAAAKLKEATHVGR